eukprot:scaffold3464_cov406-Prasinococcus_capsulatus_cf.AAC.16
MLFRRVHAQAIRKGGPARGSVHTCRDQSSCLWRTGAGGLRAMERLEDLYVAMGGCATAAMRRALPIRPVGRLTCTADSYGRLCAPLTHSYSDGRQASLFRLGKQQHDAIEDDPPLPGDDRGQVRICTSPSHEEVLGSCLSVRSAAVQVRIEDACRTLLRCARGVQSLGLFSSNEDADDVSTADLKSACTTANANPLVVACRTLASCWERQIVRSIVMLYCLQVNESRSRESIVGTASSLHAQFLALIERLGLRWPRAQSTHERPSNCSMRTRSSDEQEAEEPTGTLRDPCG